MTTNACFPPTTPSELRRERLFIVGSQAFKSAESREQTLKRMQSPDEKTTSRWPLLWAGPGQTPPDTEAGEEAWRTWLFLGGRGAGKTFAGARWLADRALPDTRLALVGPSLHDVREVMIDGPSGLIALAEPGVRPHYEALRRRQRSPGQRGEGQGDRDRRWRAKAA